MSNTTTVRGFGMMEVAGESRPFAVGTNQAYIFCNMPSQKEDGKALSLPAYFDLFSDSNRLLGGPYRDFVYSALVAGAERTGQVLDYDNLTVGDWMDSPENDPEELAKPFNEMLAQIKAKAEAQVERQKKTQGQPVAKAKKGSNEEVSADPA